MKLVFLLEERSAAEALQGLLPRVLSGDVRWILVPHEGKQDLERSIPRKLRAWREPDIRFVVLRDQDSADCERVKGLLVEMCRDAGRPDTLVRVACRELESWFLGDLAAVEEALRVRNLAKQQGRAKFRDPDRLGSPSQELKHLVKTYQKMSGARAIGPRLDLDANRSHSFNVFLRGIRRLGAADAS